MSLSEKRLIYLFSSQKEKIFPDINKEASS
jgi:hypothetical protein